MSYPIRIVILFCLGWAVLYANRTSLFPMLPLIGGEFGLSSTQAGAIGSAYFLAYVLFQAPAGLLCDRFGARRVLLVMCALAGSAVVATALLATSYPALLALVGLHGLGAGAYFSGAYSTNFATVPERLRGISAAAINSGMAVGTVIGLAAAGPLYLATESWRTPFLVLGVPYASMALVFALGIRDAKPLIPPPVRVVALLRDRTLRLLFLAGFCSLYGFFTALTWGPTFFWQERGLGLELAGIYTAIIAVAAVPAGLAFGAASDRLGRRRLSLVMLPLAAVTLVAMAWVTSLPMLALVLVGYGLLGKLAWDPVVTAWIADRVAVIEPQAMGAAMGLFSLIAVASAVVTPVLSGLIRDLTGSLAGAFYLAAAITLLGAVLAALAPARNVYAGAGARS